MSRRRNRVTAEPMGEPVGESVGVEPGEEADPDTRMVYAWASWKEPGEGHHFRRVRLPLSLVLEHAETHDPPDSLGVTIAKLTRDVDRLAFKDAL